MPSKRKASRKKAAAATAAAYFEDLGSKGVKCARAQENASASFDLPLTKAEKSRRAKRMERFSQAEEAPVVATGDSILQSLPTPRKTKKRKENEQAKDESSFVGICQDLEKPYFRLTTFPQREKVRPSNVLIKAVAHIKHKFIQEEDFAWVNDQLKSVRQDITVQRIRNNFVLDVYETHARILLEHGELAEFNQCQSMILSLTTGSVLDDEAVVGNKQAQNEGGAVNSDTFSELQQSKQAADEFAAYRVLYALIQNSGWDLKRAIESNMLGKYDPSSVLRRPAKSGQGEPIGNAFAHALHIAKAVSRDDYRSFFRLYETAPHLSAYLMDFLVRRMRQTGLDRIVASYRPTVSIEHVREALFLQDLEEARRSLRQLGVIFVKEQGSPPFWVDCRATSIATGTGIHKSDAKRKRHK